MPIVIVPPIDGSPIPPGPVPSSVVVTPQIAPLLPLDTFRGILGFNPFHFWGLAGSAVPVDSQCNTVIAEYAYQSTNAGGRWEIRQALINAQEKLRGYLQYPIAPQYVSEKVTYPSYLDQRIIRVSPSDPTGGWVSVFTPDGYLQAIGLEALTLLDTVAVAYSDEYGTGVNDTFTISVTTTETDPNNIAVYFAQADRLNSEDVGAAWRIEPVNVSITGGVATITGRAWLLVKPILYQKYTRINPIDPGVAGNFVTTLEIYTRTTTATGTTVDTAQGAFSWDSIPNYGWWGFCCGNSSDPAGVAQAIARVGIRNAYEGVVIPGEAIYNETTQQWNMTIPPWSGICRPPQQVTVRYLAGYPLQANGQMDARFARAVSYLAMAELGERICACDNANRTLWRYQQELNRTSQAEDTFATTREMLNNPLGNRRGHWQAWNEIKALRLVRGTSTG